MIWWLAFEKKPFQFWRSYLITAVQLVFNFKRISILRNSVIGNQTTQILSNFVKKTDFENRNANAVDFFLFVFFWQSWTKIEWWGWLLLKSSIYQLSAINIKLCNLGKGLISLRTYAKGSWQLKKEIRHKKGSCFESANYQRFPFGKKIDHAIF